MSPLGTIDRHLPKVAWIQRPKMVKLRNLFFWSKVWVGWSYHLPSLFKSKVPSAKLLSTLGTLDSQFPKVALTQRHRWVKLRILFYCVQSWGRVTLRPPSLIHNIVPTTKLLSKLGKFDRQLPKVTWTQRPSLAKLWNFFNWGPNFGFGDSTTSLLYLKKSPYGKALVREKKSVCRNALNIPRYIYNWIA